MGEELTTTPIASEINISNNKVQDNLYITKNNLKLPVT